VAGEDYVARAGTVRFAAADPSPTTGSAHSDHHSGHAKAGSVG